MFGRGKSSLSKPKKVHSLENLRYLHSVLQKNRAVNEQNYGILVEALRLIAEILIWGDQNDSSVMDFFLEKNILEYFLQYMKQDLSRRICVQLLQTLNILFENITNQTAIYYLLSNNHTNAIITHRFDFADEEVMAYYISFLKILSFRLNVNTISFFYIESRREFDLYVEAIKLFAHPEGMVRIAVRTITLNVHKVKDEAALEFIHHQTSLIYFSHLVWSIGNTILDIDCHKCQTKLKDLVAEHIDHLHYIDDLLSLGIEGLNEVLCDQLLRRLFIPLHIYSLFKQYKSDATTNLGTVRRPRLSYSVTVFTLIHVYLFLRDTRLICLLTEAILIGDLTLPGLIIPCNIPCSNSQIVFNDSTTQDCSVSFQNNLNYDETDDTASDDDPAMNIARTLIAATVSLRASDQASPGKRLTAYLIHSVTSKNPLIFSQPSESLEHGLTQAKGVTPTLMSVLWPPNMAPLKLVGRNSETCAQSSSTSNPCEKRSSDLSPGDSQIQSSNSCTDVSSIEKSPVKIEDSSFNSSVVFEQNDKPIDADLSNLSGRVFLRSLFRSLGIGSGSDQDALFSILLLFAIKSNKGVDLATLKLAQLDGPDIKNEPSYNYTLVTKLIELIGDACKAGSRIRLITVRMAIRLLTDLVYSVSCGCQLSDQHFAGIINSREEAMLVLRSYFEISAIFLDLFENELRRIQSALPLLSTLATDARLLIKPYSSFLEQSEITKDTTNAIISSNKMQMLTCNDMDLIYRLPNNEREHVQRAIGIYLLVHIWLERMLSLKMNVTSCQDVIVDTDNICSSVHNSEIFPNDLFSNLVGIPGLGGFCSIPDPKSTTPALKTGDRLDLFSETLIGCTVECSGIHEKRFIVSCGQQLVLVKPDSKQLGWGVITFIGPLQDLESHCDPADSRCLHVTIHAPGHLTCQNSSPGRLFSNINNTNSKSPIMVAKFLFEDHIRCMTARQLLSRGKTVVEQTKLRKIASLLDFPPQFIREKFLANNTSTGYNSGIVGSKNYMCNNQHTMIVNNRLDPANTRGMHLNSISSSGRRIGTNVITGTKRAEQSPPVQTRKFISDNDNNTNNDSSSKTGEGVRPGDCLVGQQGNVNTSGCLHDTYGTDASSLVAPLVYLASSNTSAMSITKATESIASTSTLGEPVVKPNPLLNFTITKTPNSRMMNQQEISQLTTSSSVHKTVGIGKRITEKKEEKQHWPQQHEDDDDEEEQTVDEKRKLINLSKALSNLKPDMSTNDYLSGNKQAEHNYLSSESKQLNYSSGNISDV
uniref:FPL domain-containing protein n=1 Tax=Schistosoma mansoni TaxID=6183 RepID=A0A5K4FAM9_SCHMA